MSGMTKLGKIGMAILAIAAIASPSFAATFEFHGDFNHRFNLYTNHSDFYATGGSMESGVAGTEQINNDTSNTVWGDVKYRLWTEAATNDGNIKGVYAIELGGIRFGQTNYTKGGGAEYSGDGVNIETRWAYTDFCLPDTEKARFKIGLLPFAINDFVWNETAMGVVFDNAISDINYQVAWVRGREYFNDAAQDQDSSDALAVRVVLTPMEESTVGLFALYQHADPLAGLGEVDAGKYEVKKLGDVDLDLYTVGVDGSLTRDAFFVNWDLIYQGGDVKNATYTGMYGIASGDFSLSAYLAHGDIGMNIGRTRLTYTTWYASGDDNDSDQDFNAFISTDVDRADSVVLFEGGYVDDNYGTERPYVLDKGLFLNKIAVDSTLTDKLSVGGAFLYMMTAQDILYLDDNGATQSNSDLGFEVDAYASYKLYENLELAVNAGYLLAGDGMDVFETNRDGSADEDIYRITSRVRYKF